MQPTPTATSTVAPTGIEGRIRRIRDQKIMLDTDLAGLYGVATSALVQAVKRNADRFPGDFMFQLDAAEWDILKSQSVISRAGHGGRRSAPYAFTEQGVAMLSPVLGSAQAIAVNIEIVRAFVRLREIIVSNKELAQRLRELEHSAELMSSKFGTLEHNTRTQFIQVFDAIRELMAPPERVKKRPIGLVTPDEAPVVVPRAPKARK